MELQLISDKPRTLHWGEITEAHTKALEQEIRKNPSQWLWSHRRWKREVPEDQEKLKKEQYEKFQNRYR